MKADIDINSSANEYTVHVGTDLLESELGNIFSGQYNKHCFALIDENVWVLHQDNLKAVFETVGIEVSLFLVPPGEQSKGIDTWNRALDFLLQNEVRRNTPVLAIGGGITGDLAGFVASSALRGVPLIHIPTTLLAMVDSSIGGKTGINHPTGKNLIGAFYQPECVISDVKFLKTLPDKEWANGLSEILKYGIIEDNTIIEDSSIFLNGTFPDFSSSDELITLIEKCIRVKADVVAKDEFEGGVRAFLNFGHTFAHALEKAFKVNTISHGEAVYLGMISAIDLSERISGSNIQSPLSSFRGLYNFNIDPEDFDLNNLLSFMKNDKKNRDEFIRFVLLKELQHPYLKTVIDEDLIKKSWLAAVNVL